MGSNGPILSEVAGFSTAVIDDLSTRVKNSTVLTPGCDEYKKAIIRWSDAVEKEAGIVVYVTTPEDISSTIIFCRENHIPFVVSGGKHSSSGSSSIGMHGLVIDMAKMRAVTVDPATKTAVVQGGCIWYDVDTKLAEFGLAGVGGTINHTGVGGLTLGGGYGWLSGRYGLTIDNLLAATVVLADGRIVKCSEEENADLFWAIRGAGQCFCVAVDFTFQAHDQKNTIWAGQLVFSADQHLESVVSFANHLVEVTNGDQMMVMGITSPPFLKGGIAVIATVFYNGPTSEAEKFFAPLIELGPIKNTCAERPYCEMNGMMNHAVDYGGRKSSKGAAFVTPISPTFVKSLVEELKFFHQEVSDTRKTIMLFEFFHPTQWLKKSRSSMAFANRGDHQNAMLGPFWNDAANDMPCRKWSRHVAKLFEEELERVKIERGNPAAMAEITEYGNYDALTASAERIFGANYKTLVTLKAKYDPENAFSSSYSLM